MSRKSDRVADLSCPGFGSRSTEDPKVEHGLRVEWSFRRMAKSCSEVVWSLTRGPPPRLDLPARHPERRCERPHADLR